MLRRIAMSALTALVASGCGTVANTLWLDRDQGGKRVYGGVLADIEVARETSKAPPAKDSGLAIGLAALDVPFSAVADTATLPVTLWWACHTQNAKQESSRPAQ
jgi:uncharacterized protein YceK